MPVLRDIPITLSADEILATQMHRRTRLDLVGDAQATIDQAAGLWQPEAVYDWFEVGTVCGEQVTLHPPAPDTAETTLLVGPKADLLAAARQVLVSVGTIGPALERRVRELSNGGEALRAYLLDSAGVVALGAVGAAVRQLAEEEATTQGWGVSPSLSPGSLVGWPLHGQKELCTLLPLDSIGVRLNSHGVLEPHKSASGLIGLGPDYKTTKVGSVCHYCALNETCWRRREDPA